MTTASTARASAALAAVVELAEGLGLEAAGAVVERVGTSVLVGLPSPRVLARVDDRTAPRRVRDQVAVAELLAERQVPAVRLVGPGQQPHLRHVGGAEVAITLWRWESLVRAPVAPRALGGLARRLHDATAGVGPAVPRCDPLDALGDLLRSAPGPAADVELLEAQRQRLASPWADLRADGDPVVHGDLHRDNVLVTAEGLVLADLELAGVGPWAYDLAPQVVAVRRYGAPGQDLDAFLEGYGRPLPDPAVLEPLVEVDELWVTAWAVANRHLDAAHEAEARLRLARFRGGAGDGGRWHLR